MVTVGAVIDRPVVLHNKTTSPQGDNQLFPSEIPIFAMQILGGRSMIAPTTHRNDSSTNRNLQIRLSVIFYFENSIFKIEKVRYIIQNKKMFFGHFTP
jgi:hypothetical protein